MPDHRRLLVHVEAGVVDPEASATTSTTFGRSDTLGRREREQSRRY
jgi:hypothetical protein